MRHCAKNAIAEHSFALPTDSHEIDICAKNWKRNRFAKCRQV